MGATSRARAMCSDVAWLGARGEETWAGERGPTGSGSLRRGPSQGTCSPPSVLYDRSLSPTMNRAIGALRRLRASPGPLRCFPCQSALAPRIGIVRAPLWETRWMSRPRAPRPPHQHRPRPAVRDRSMSRPRTPSPPASAPPAPGNSRESSFVPRCSACARYRQRRLPWDEPQASTASDVEREAIWSYTISGAPTVSARGTGADSGGAQGSRADASAPPITRSEGRWK